MQTLTSKALLAFMLAILVGMRPTYLTLDTSIA